MPERAATLHEAMAAVLDERGGWMDRAELAAEISRRELWVRPSDGAPPGEDQIGLRARKNPDRFELSEDKKALRLRTEEHLNTPEGRRVAVKPASKGRAEGIVPAPLRRDVDKVWSLTENDIVAACRKLLEENGYEILTSATTVERGPDLIARSTDSRTEIRVEAKGATSSKGHTRRYGRPFTSGQVLQHVSRAFYTATAARSSDSSPAVRSALALPDTTIHRARIDPLAVAIAELDLGIIWVDGERVARLEAHWQL